MKSTYFVPARAHDPVEGLGTIGTNTTRIVGWAFKAVAIKHGLAVLQELNTLPHLVTLLMS